MAYPCAPSANFCNEYFGFPSKYNSIFNKETPCFGGFDRPCPTSFPWSNWTGSYPGSFPGSNWTGSFPGSNWTGSYPSNWTGSFPGSNWTGSYPGSFPSNWTGSFPGSNWTGSFPGSNWTGSYPGSFPSTWTGANNNSTWCSTGFRPSCDAEYYTLKNPIRVYENGCRGLWLCFDLRGYKPEEITVTLNKAERCIVIEAGHDIKEAKEFNIIRKFYRKFVLPEYTSKVDLAKVELKAFFGPDGYFYVEGVFPKSEECYSWPAVAPFFGGAWNNNTFGGSFPWSNNWANSWNPTWNNNTFGGSFPWSNNWSNWNPTWNNNTFGGNYPSSWTNSNSWECGKPVTCKFI